MDPKQPKPDGVKIFGEIKVNTLLVSGHMVTTVHALGDDGNVYCWKGSLKAWVLYEG